MHATRIVKYGLMVGCLVAWSANASANTAFAASLDAEGVYRITGVQGGLVVHLGCGDGKATADLRMNDRYLVQGLDDDPAMVEQARESLQAKGLYGPISIDLIDGLTLPFVSDTVNLVIVNDPCGVSQEEIHRVLAPRGAAFMIDKGTGKTDVSFKPVPEEVDEWSHFLHDSGGNAVAEDRLVGSPTRLRWVAAPRYCRSHEVPSSIGSVITVNGRIFSIIDEGTTGMLDSLPQECKLVARDAANGVLLWKQPLKQWQPEFGTGVGNRWNIHHTIPRRIVADDERVYATLQFLDSAVSILDAATGEILVDAIEGTQGADELLLCDGVLIVKTRRERSVGATARIPRNAMEDTLIGIDVATGKQLWRKPGVQVVPYALSALDGTVVYHNMDELVSLDLRTGEEQWQTPHLITSIMGGDSTLVLRDGVVLYHGPWQEDANAKSGRHLSAYSLKDGSTLWRVTGGRGQVAAATQPTDVFVCNGTVWCGGATSGRNLHTGEVVQTVELDKLISPGHHYRCHRSKATERFLIWPKRGAEFVDLEEGEHMRNDWLRAPCFTGTTPANGLLYVPSNQCFCYPGVLMSGFLALSAEPTEPVTPATDANLEKGPAYEPDAPFGLSPADSDCWIMHRHNHQRSGSTETRIPAAIKPQWEVQFPSQASQPVILEDRLLVAENKTHQVHCFNATNGEKLWSFTAGGPVDSSPFVLGPWAYFGCRDGSVYCVRISDGELAWRFQAAPNDQKIVSYGQLESLWPVHGSVTVLGGVVYFTAGRSSFLDGGMIVYGLNYSTGEVLYTHVLEGPRPDIKTDTGAPFAMEGSLPDLLVTDGEYLYMQRVKFDRQLNRMDTIQESSLGELDMGADHLVATGGFLNDTGFDRIYWMYSHRWPGFYFSQHSPKAGQLVVFDDETTFAVKYFYRRIQWSVMCPPGEQGYLLFADDNDNQPIFPDKKEGIEAIEWLPKEAYSDNHRRGGRGVEKGTGYQRQLPPKWQTMIPSRVRAMLLSGDLLFTVGLPDVVAPNDPTASFKGRMGSLLNIYSKKDGSLVASYELDSAPAFDGMSAANGRLYLATTDGKVICFGAAE